VAHDREDPDDVGGDRPDPLDHVAEGGSEVLGRAHVGPGVVDRAGLVGAGVVLGLVMKPTNRRPPKAARRRAWASMAASEAPAAMSAQRLVVPPKTRFSQPSNRIRPPAAYACSSGVGQKSSQSW
jgi:hypothetical protein